MKTDLLKYSVGNLKSRLLRSFLSTLSILIGIMAIYAILSFGQGLSSYIDSVSADMGTDKIIIQGRTIGAPGTGNVVFDDTDLDFVDRVKGVKATVPLAFEALKVEYRNSGAKYVYGISYPIDDREELFWEGFGVDVLEGRRLKDGDLTTVLLGYNYQFENKIFKRAIKLGDKIEINGQRMEVVGFIEEIGNPSDDANTYMTFDTMKFLTGEDINYAMIYAQADKGEDPEALAERVKEKLRKHRGLEKGQEDFEVQTFAELIATFSTIIDGLNAVLFVIALISVVVAAVNIMNTMYTAVLERTNEIGVLKAIGAKNSTILMLFVTEAGILGLIGGGVGLLFGFGIAKFGGFLAANAGYALLQPKFPIWLTLGCLAFAFLVGAVSGILPSIQASKLEPVDALRYE